MAVTDNYLKHEISSVILHDKLVSFVFKIRNVKEVTAVEKLIRITAGIVFEEEGNLLT